MNRISQGLIILVVMWLSALSHAVEPLSQHALAVSQSMSAFYMVSLTEGDKRYIREFEDYANDAEQHLKAYQKKDSVKASELANQWYQLRPHLKHDFVEGAGFIVNNTTRYQFRSYLSHVYQQLLDSSLSESGLDMQLTNTAISVEVMAARFFDVSSALYGTMSLAGKDMVIDPKKMAAAVNNNLSQMQNSKQVPEGVKRSLRSVNTKWKFIEETVTDYKGEAAVYLVYFNKKQITKLLLKSQEQIAKA